MVDEQNKQNHKSDGQERCNNRYHLRMRSENRYGLLKERYGRISLRQPACHIQCDVLQEVGHADCRNHD